MSIKSLSSFLKKDFQLEIIVFYIIIISIFLIPPISIPKIWFSIYLSDFFVPIILLILIKNKLLHFNFYSKLLGLFSFYILLTIVINNRIACISDYFEIFKVIKFGLFIIFFAFIIPKLNYKLLISYIFFITILLNFLHYFNLFNFNKFIEPFYAEEIHLKFFGLNSLGFPDTKRMLGTMGNPNNNAILFLFFTIFYLPIKNEKLINYSFFFIAYIGLLLCQSRTGLIVFTTIFIINCYIQKYNKKELFFLIIGLILLFNISNLNYLLSLFNEQVMRTSASTMGRLEIWAKLWEMIKLKPIFGYAPYKDYFYSNNLFSENEYILMTWRYGFIGLLLYLAIVILPIAIYFKKITLTNIDYLKTFLFTFVILITALTNNPLSEPRIILIFAFMLAFIFKFDINKIPYAKK